MMRHATEPVLEFDQTEVEFTEPAPPVNAPPESSVLMHHPWTSSVPAVVVGILAGFDETGAPLVTFAENTERVPLPARSTVGLSHRQIGSELALVFAQGDLTKPIILGCIRSQALALAECGLKATSDGEQVHLSAKREIVFRCGKSSITLTKTGKITIRGAHLLSRSSGVNRIKGGSVQIN